MNGWRFAIFNLTMPPRRRLAFNLITISFFALACGRASHEARVDLSGHGLISPASQESVRAIVNSVVGISAVVDYRLEFFHHEMRHGQFVPEPGSPTGYRLIAGPNAIKTAKKIQKTSGGGVIISQDTRQTLILTCEHVINSPDTVRTFFRDAEGRETKVLASRAVKRRETCQVINQVNQLEPAEVLYVDPRADLGLLLAQSSPTVGVPFSRAVAYQTELKWGDLAFVFGYPREIKQLSLGFISPSPYPGTFSMDVVARYGFSGGPVLLVRPGGELELAGIIRGVPVSKLRYIAPPPELAPGQNLEVDDLKISMVDEFDLIEYGTVYAVGAERIGKFLKESQAQLQKKGIDLPKRFFPN
ncbi:MAG: serine protease [candidate division KSB1 bacterium]|nr:serine protease [candidate division KSB1 bacterium]MDZ7365907.1 serine protease [candidate division KSB1 bacterium]MDZ7403859.1 serine protease [candidate division KSB1 bacterium]